MNPADAPNLNYAWCGLLVEELIRQGVAGFVISPGSRSAPLTVSVARNKRAKYWVHYDERGAGFFALGLAKATGKPAVLICTSGSAVANYGPAVVEAAMDRVPLILLTADRPPELVDCGANQAIDQTDIYGRYTRWRTALPCPTTECPPAYVLTTADQAWHRSQHPLAGPVHINVPLREPLDPEQNGSVTKELFESLAAWTDNGTPYTRYDVPEPKMPEDIAAQIVDGVRAAKRGLLIIGRLESSADRATVHELAETLGWPVYADITSGLHGPDTPKNMNPDFEGFLTDVMLEKLEAEHNKSAWIPDLVLHVGGGYLSKLLLGFLSRSDAPYIHVAHSNQRLDPNHKVSQRITMPVSAFCQWMRDICQDHPDMNQNQWAAPPADLDDVLAPAQVHSEINIARQLGALLPKGSLLFAGNSMPIRLVERFCRPKHKGIHIAANRGASGIDGNMATALGMATGSGQTMTALLGDLTTLHDLNSLALHKEVKTPVIIVVLNNDGGGIFNYLPIAHADEPCFERCFGTPHGMNFEGAARMFGVTYCCPETPTAFTAAYQRALEINDTTLIEIRTNRYDARHPHHGESSTLPKNLPTAFDAMAYPHALHPTPLAGDPENPPLLLLHGFMGEMDDWEGLARALGDTHYVLGVHLPGHGPGWEDTVAASYRMDVYGAILNRLLGQMGITRCALLGYSMGGRTALYLATKFPERFTRVVLESASPGLDSKEKRQAREVQDLALWERLIGMEPGSDEYRAFLEEWYDLPLFESLRTRPQLRDELIDRRLANNTPRILADSLSALGTGIQPNLWPALADYRTPTLLLVGEQDRKYRIIAEDMCAACPAMAMEVFANCGHIVHLESPDAMITSLRNFLHPQ